jgi:hypothetical protein
MTERTVPVILDLSCRGIVMDYLFLKLYHIFAGSRNGGESCKRFRFLPVSPEPFMV